MRAYWDFTEVNVAELPPEAEEQAEELVAERSARGVLLQALGCFGCLGLVVAAFVLMGLAILRADQVTLTEPAAVEANLQAIVACSVPKGFRGFRGMHKEGRRIALIAPHTHSGLKVPVAGRLTLALWTFDPEAPRSERAAEVMTYWRSKISDHYGLGAEAGEPVGEGIDLQLRGAPLHAQRYEFTRKGEVLRLVVAFFPRDPQGAEEVALTAIAEEEHFDAQALEQFLESIK
jgi:hypothetical protein